MTAYPELFECRSCYHIGPLDKHGRCQRCGSDSVISQALILMLPVVIEKLAKEAEA